MSSGTLPSLDPRHTALVVVDMQNDFVDPRGFFGQKGLDLTACNAVIPRIQAVVRQSRTLGLSVVYTATVHTTDSLEPGRHRVLPLRDRNAAAARTAVCLQRTWGAEVVDPLRPEPGDLLIEKRRYSAFFETDFDRQLRAREIDTLVVAGATTNVCVDSTVRDAYFRGYDVVVLEDCVASYEQDLHAATLRNVDLLFGMVVSAENLPAMLGAGETATVA